MTSVLVQKRDENAMYDSLSYSKRLGVAKVHAQGNVLSFSVDTQSYLVQCLAPDQFVAELVAISNGSHATFAHDALQYRLDNGRTTDPLHANGQVRLNRRSTSPEAMLGDVLEGLIAAGMFGLSLDPTFEQAQSDLLNNCSVQGPDAIRIVRTFLKTLPALAAAMPASAVAGLLNSPLLVNAFGAHSGTSTARIVSRFAQLRSNHSARESDSALWLAAISSTGTDVAATGWIDHSTPGRRQAFLSAASRASQLA